MSIFSSARSIFEGDCCDDKNWRGPWTANKYYGKDTVIYDPLTNIIYKTVTAHRSGSAINLTNFTVLGGGSGTFTQLSLDVVSGVNGGATTIQNDVVTNAKLANMATQTFKGRTTAGTGDPEDLTLAQVKALLGYTAGTILTTAALVIGGTTYPIGTSLQVIVTALNANLGGGGGSTLDSGIFTTASMTIDSVVYPIGTTVAVIEAALVAAVTNRVPYEVCQSTGVGGTESGYDKFVVLTNPVTRTLAPATAAGRKITYYNASAGTVTINPNGTDLLNDANTAITIAAGEAVTIEVLGGNKAYTISNFNTSAASTGVTLGRATNAVLKSDIKYFVVSGAPVVTFAKAGGTGTITVAGGTIDYRSIQVDLDTTADVDASGNFSLVVNGLQASTMLEYPIAIWVDTKAGALPSVTPHVEKNPGSAPVVSFSGGTAGSSITVKSVSSLLSIGNTVSLVVKFG